MSMYLSPLQRIKRIILLARIYMESGFLDHRSTGPGLEDSYKPAIIEFNGFVSGKALLNASADREVVDGDLSWAVGCHGSEIADVYYDDGVNAYEFHSATPDYCAIGILDKKNCQLRCPPSMFTGKLRLMVQSIYGSLRADYSGPATSNEQPYLKIDTGQTDGDGDAILVTLDTGFTNCGLYTDPSGKYWLIQMGSIITARKMLSSLYNADLSALGVDTADPLSEAYLLSTLIPDTIAIELGPWPVLSGEAPLAYGWKFNDTGSEASIVVVKTNSAIPCYNAAGVPQTANGIDGTLYTVNFGWNSESLLPTLVGYDVVASGSHIPFTQAKIFYPLWLEKIIKCVTAGSDAQADRFADLTCPIYCYYKGTSLEVFTARNARSYGYGAHIEYDPPERNRFWKAGMDKLDVVGIENAWTRIDVASKTVVGQRGFTSTSQGDVTQGVVYYNQAAFTTGWYNLDPQDSNGWVTFDNYDTVSFPQRFGHPNDAPSFFRRNLTNAVKRYRGSFVVPFYDAEAAITAEQISEDYLSESKFSRYAEENLTAYYRVYDADIVNGQVVIGAYIRDDHVFQAADNDGLWGNVDAPATDEEWDAVADLQIGKNKLQRATLFSPRLSNGYFEIFSENVANEGAVGSLDQLFFVTFVDPFIYVPIEVRTGFYSGVTASLISGVSYAVDWPGADYLVPVGWA